MVAFEGREPVGVLLGAKRRDATLVHALRVHPEHRRRGHARHLLTSLGQKLAILGPPRLVAEVPADRAPALRPVRRLRLARARSGSSTGAATPPIRRTAAREREPVADEPDRRRSASTRRSRAGSSPRAAACWQRDPPAFAAPGRPPRRLGFYSAERLEAVRRAPRPARRRAGRARAPARSARRRRARAGSALAPARRRARAAGRRRAARSCRGSRTPSSTPRPPRRARVSARRASTSASPPRPGRRRLRRADRCAPTPRSPATAARASPSRSPSSKRAIARAPRRRPPLVAVGSGKGGVGKSTLTRQLAAVLARARPAGRHPRRRPERPEPGRAGRRARVPPLPGEDGLLAAARAATASQILSVGSLLADGRGARPGPSADAGALPRLARDARVREPRRAPRRGRTGARSTCCSSTCRPGPSAPRSSPSSSARARDVVLVTIPSALARGVVARSVDAPARAARTACSATSRT